MDNEFRSILLEGAFYQAEDGGLWVSQTTSTLQVESELVPLLGLNLQVALHFNPPRSFDPTLWGGGSCLWQPTGKCPVGHHENPGLMLNLAGAGVLCRDGKAWWLHQDSGENLILPLSLLEGHYARVVMLSILSLTPQTGLADLENQASKLRDLMSQLSSMLGEV